MKELSNETTLGDLRKLIGEHTTITVSIVVNVAPPAENSGVKRNFCSTTFKALYLGGTRPIDIMTEMEISPTTYYRLEEELSAE